MVSKISENAKLILGFSAGVGLSLLVYFRKRSDLADSLIPNDGSWRVIRCAALNKETRASRGDGPHSDGGETRKGPQRKIACFNVELRKEGVHGSARTCSGGEESVVTIVDYNNYRSNPYGNASFPPGTLDRAVTLLPASIYDELRRLIPKADILWGDLGENLTIYGPAHTGDVLKEGVCLQIGETVKIQLMEANKPCSRLQYVAWAAAAEKAFGHKDWWNDMKQPLKADQKTGGRGWLCKVLVEGHVQPGAEVKIVNP
eukprot:gnl/MRDRNA2_/MRDRNA2_79766_c0_seq1.p1 gnl/MRDRNA2_/MRDRNA2_79766_c0~~gnl/MRDRNA2_/MRDRNA2_79766_c0_seq1.p1  ORF type:complete len:259 (-),score=45.89 gnl/MRDRNA2_/MRDRNA2_79766_c0_seq1:458-1234(-)